GELSHLRFQSVSRSLPPSWSTTGPRSSAAGSGPHASAAPSVPDGAVPSARPIRSLASCSSRSTAWAGGGPSRAEAGDRGGGQLLRGGAQPVGCRQRAQVGGQGEAEERPAGQHVHL